MQYAELYIIFLSIYKLITTNVLKSYKKYFPIIIINNLK